LKTSRNKESTVIHQAVLHLNLAGTVQGVGFRPFVFALARELGLRGWVGNTSQGVELEVEGDEATLSTFQERIYKDRPSHAFFEIKDAALLPPQGYEDFKIRASRPGEKTALVLPDYATCAECLREIFDPENRRYQYPFTNCTHCGPRFSILTGLPYDRPNTTMKNFIMCADCRREYEDPRDRRFHAQPNACPACGPHLELWDPSGKTLAQRKDALLESAEALRQGKVVAVKGLGGFHLMVDARNSQAVNLLRERKARPDKPFALMFSSIAQIEKYVPLTAAEIGLLNSPPSPIVLVSQKKTTLASQKLSPQVAPRIAWLGVMLPYTPLHHLLMGELGFPIVATSGNRSEEPICTDEREALEHLAGIADFFLVHNRPIARPVDDSLARIIQGEVTLLRRARGYAPLPLSLKKKVRPILAVGGQLKNTTALTVGDKVYLSQHLGDLGTIPAQRAFAEILERFQTFYEIKAPSWAHDLHPDYTSTRFAQKNGKELLPVQHHHAHVVSCMVEHDLDGPVLGVAWDGLGYGSDGGLWGGEFLRATRKNFQRVGHIRTFPLPGGEAAFREPRRVAVGMLYEVFGERAFGFKDNPALRALTFEEKKIFTKMLRQKLNCPRSSSMGRLFDGIAALMGLRQRQSYEAQGAMELESLAETLSETPPYSLELKIKNSTAILDWEPLLHEILRDLESKESPLNISKKFHLALAQGIVSMARNVGEKRVVLTGGCFQNKVLCERAIDGLRLAGFEPYWHRRVPANDGGLALGQAAVAAENQGVESCA